MTLFALLLVGTSAFTHATWNLLCKSRTPSGAFFLVSTTASVTALLPFLLGFGYLLGTVPARFWLLLALTGAVQAVYYNMLGNAYRLTEISVAYPLARSIPILFTPMITGLFRRAFAKRKQGSAKSPIAESGGTASREAISSCATPSTLIFCAIYCL